VVGLLTRIAYESHHHVRGPRGGLRPVLLEWRGVSIHSYPAMLYVGLTLGLVVGNSIAHLAGLNSARVFIAMVLLAMAGLIGARLMFVAGNWTRYRREPRRIWRRSEGGADLLGGLLVAVAVSPPLLAALALPLGAFWDVATFVMLIWSIFGRLGCLLHGCCSGRPSAGPLALSLPDHRGIRCRRIPTQLWEAGLGVALLIGAAALWSARPFPGALFLAVMLGYGIGRLILQPMRDARDRGGHIPQVICALLVALSFIGFVLLWLGDHTRL
jgi:phosphatidylglycerol---prolipoprotein diacylglyceryl transferase